MELTCRLCARKSPSSPLKNLLESLDLLSKIKKTLPIVVIEGDPLPFGICSGCEEKLNAFSCFYDQTERVDLYLRSLLSFIPLEPTPVVDPLVIFHETQTLLGAAYKKFITCADSKLDLKENFIIKTIDKTTLYSCKQCKRTYLTETSALRHTCHEDSFSKCFVRKSSTTPNPTSKTKSQCESSTSHQPSPELCTKTSSESSAKTSNSLETRLPFVAVTELNSSSSSIHQAFRKRNREETKEKIKSRARPHCSGSATKSSHTCVTCHKEFKESTELKLHSKSHMPSSTTEVCSSGPDNQKPSDKQEKQLYVCNICHLPFTRKIKWLSHERGHLEEPICVE